MEQSEIQESPEFLHLLVKIPAFAGMTLLFHDLSLVVT